jgi:hypothetical protein
VGAVERLVHSFLNDTLLVKCLDNVDQSTDDNTLDLCAAIYRAVLEPNGSNKDGISKSKIPKRNTPRPGTTGATGATGSTRMDSLNTGKPIDILPK